MVNLQDSCLGAEEVVVPHGSVLLPESPGPWQLQPHLCPGVAVTCHRWAPLFYGLVHKSDAWEGFLWFWGGFHPSKNLSMYGRPCCSQNLPI